MFRDYRIGVQLPGISDRAFCLPYEARLWWPRKTQVKPAGGNYKSKSQLAVELIRLTRASALYVIPNPMRDPRFRRIEAEPAHLMQIFQDLVPAFSAQ
jgi:hypothetical protein